LLLLVEGIKLGFLLNDSLEFCLGSSKLVLSDLKLGSLNLQELELRLNNLGSFVIGTHGRTPFSHTFQGTRRTFSNFSREHNTLWVVSEFKFEVRSQ
jgi:hypothetical protein